MKRSLKTLNGYTIKAQDGDKGKVKDFLFDEELWIVRYVEADFGGLFKNKRVLIPRFFLEKPEWDKEHFPVKLTQENIEACPDLDERMPVSREYEKQLSNFYKIDYYWPYGYTAPPTTTAIYPPRPLTPPTKIVSEQDLDTSLRSFKEVKGYHIRAIDGKLGHIDDIIVDDQDWQVVYVIVDTSNWLPWSKKVMLGINWLEEISYVDREVSLRLHTETIKKAPEYDANRPVELDYEKAIYDFFGSSLVK